MAGFGVTVPFAPGRVDAALELTNGVSFACLEPEADPFRSYHKEDAQRGPATGRVEKAALLELSVPEMTVLVGGMRALAANAGGSTQGVFTSRPRAQREDLFVNLLDRSTARAPSASDPLVLEGRDATGKLRFTAAGVGLVFGSNSELRAIAEDFVAAWTQVMESDRFDLHR